MARILAIDAQEDFITVLKEVLACYRHEVSSAGTAAEGLLMIERCTPDVIVLDADLPDMSPDQVLRKLPSNAQQVPVFVLATDLSQQEEHKIRESGAAAWFHKGLCVKTLRKLFTRLLEETGSLLSRPRAVSGPGDMIGRLLIVDDEQEIVELISEFLSRRGFDVHTANTGEDALRFVEDLSPDLILMDIYMPGTNGMDVLRRLAGNAAAAGTRAPAVVMLTGSQERLLLDEAVNLGALDVIQKPVDLNHLELAVLIKLALSIRPRLADSLAAR